MGSQFFRETEIIGETKQFYQIEAALFIANLVAIPVWMLRLRLDSALMPKHLQLLKQAFTDREYEQALHIILAKTKLKQDREALQILDQNSKFTVYRTCLETKGLEVEPCLDPGSDSGLKLHGHQASTWLTAIVKIPISLLNKHRCMVINQSELSDLTISNGQAFQQNLV